MQKGQMIEMRYIQEFPICLHLLILDHDRATKLNAVHAKRVRENI